MRYARREVGRLGCATKDLGVGEAKGGNGIE
jgi:hypothetical protein